MSAQTGSSPPSPETESDAGEGAGHSAPSPAEAFRGAFAELHELREFAMYYVSARVDALKITARRALIMAFLGLIFAIAGATIFVVSVVLMVKGVAAGLGELFPAHPWLGEIIVGLVVLFIPVIGILIGMRILTRTFKTLTVQKYETRQRRQRQQYGRSVRDEAARAPDSAGKAH